MAEQTWEVTILELRNDHKTFKVTKRFPAYGISETKFFTSETSAKRQLNHWLEELFHTRIEH